MAEAKDGAAGPFQYEHSIEIAKPAEVYALLEWADPRHAQRALGNKVEPVGSAPVRFCGSISCPANASG